VIHTAQKIADLRGCDGEEFCRQSSFNARNVFSLPVVADSRETSCFKSLT